MAQRQPNGQHAPSMEERLEMQRTQSEHSEAAGIASDIARQQVDPDAMRQREFVETFLTPEVDRDGTDDVEPQFEELLAAQLNKFDVLGNISRRDWERERLLSHARATMIKQLYPRPTGAGSKCRGETRSIMTDEHREMPTLTHDWAIQIDQIMEHVVPMRMSLAKGGRGFRGFTEVTARVRSESFDANQNSGGITGRISRKLFGGGG